MMWTSRFETNSKISIQRAFYNGGVQASCTDLDYSSTGTLSTKAYTHGKKSPNVILALLGFEPWSLRDLTDRRSYPQVQ